MRKFLLIAMAVMLLVSCDPAVTKWDGKAADTLVLINGHLLGKPQDKCDAERILRELSGAYRLQKTGYEPVDKIDGNWTTIVGLPLKKIMDSI